MTLNLFRCLVLYVPHSFAKQSYSGQLISISFPVYILSLHFILCEVWLDFLFTSTVHVQCSTCTKRYLLNVLLCCSNFIHSAVWIFLNFLLCHASGVLFVLHISAHHLPLSHPIFLLLGGAYWLLQSPQWDASNCKTINATQRERERESGREDHHDVITWSHYYMLCHWLKSLMV